MKMSETPDPLTNMDEKPVSEKKPSRHILRRGFTALVFVILALSLGLGLGLGLGLRHHNHTSTTTTPPTSSGRSSTSAAPIATSTILSSASEVLQSWRRDTSDYNLDMSWDLNAAPTTRIFNLTVSEIQAAPDGRNLLSPG